MSCAGLGGRLAGTRVVVLYGLITQHFFRRAGVSPGYKVQTSVLSQLNGGLQEAMGAFGHCRWGVSIGGGGGEGGFLQRDGVVAAQEPCWWLRCKTWEDGPGAPLPLLHHDLTIPCIAGGE